MPTNDFLPFGSAVGANVMSQADYLALAARLNGFSSGTANSAQLNKAWRQSSIVAAVIGQLIANRSGQNAVDDGTTATLLANLELAINGLSQIGSGSYAAGGGTANAHTAAFNPPVAALTDGMVLKYKASVANTGACTFNPNGLGAKPLVGFGHSALQGGEIVVNSDVWLQYNTSIGGGSWVLIDSSGGALQVAPATQSQHAVQFSQVAGVVGQARNLRMSVAAASATATLTADEIVVETALGGLRYCLASFNKTINLATTGAGGMDTGTAPVNGFVGIYAIYNPTSGASALLAVNAASVVASVYGGANMPAGYSASALVGVWLTNGSGQFIVGYQSDRFTCYTTTTVLITSAVTGSITSLSIAAVVPPNAKYISGNTLISCSAASVIHLDIHPSTAAVGNKQNYSTTTAANGGNAVSFDRLQLLTPQTMGYYATSTAGTPSFQIAITGYEI